MALLDTFLSRGWLRFAADDATRAWAEHALPMAAEAAKDPAQAHWLRCGGTWFVGVDALPNDAEGRLPGGPPLGGAAVDFITGALGLKLPMHRAQLSVCYPGYPQPSPEESEAAYGFRLRRDAAHVDGLLAEGPARARQLKEPHAYVLGIGLTPQTEDAAPLTVWEGSHHTMREMFAACFAGHAPERWGEVDVTAPYQQARRAVFDSCRRVVLASAPGEAVLLHRHLLHGVAPWGKEARATADGRMVAYFRPEFTMMRDWLEAP